MRHTVLHIIVLSVCGLFDSTAQITFQKVVESGEYLTGNSIALTFDGGYILTGNVWSNDGESSNVSLTKIDKQGNVIWSKKYGGEKRDLGLKVTQTSDSGYAIAGSTDSFSMYGDLYLVKTDSEGNEQWSKTFGSLGDDVGNSGISTSDGGFALIGAIDKSTAGRSRDIFLVKADSSGNTQWVKEFGTTEYEQGEYIQQTFDEGFIIGGFADSKNPKQRNIVLIKTDRLGNKMWTRLYKGEGVRILTKVIQLKDSGYAICGDIHDKNKVPPRSDALVIRTDSLGSVIWEKYFGINDNVDCNSIVQDTEGNLVITGKIGTYRDRKSFFVYLMSISLEGDQLWVNTYGGDDFNASSDLQQCPDGGFIIVGETKSSGDLRTKALVIKTDESGACKKFEVNTD
ncbi:TPA: hypothetical protein EYO63_16750 [Candidatus Poribacteria bacterium]|nr:hypothetical protein [Flavobacteriales bacterium]HIA12049.1 hypothetical protein [Flavobacteriales bacterium]HIC01337.1 hypothetical protein [Candidatus Poribacteria bacterium]